MQAEEVVMVQLGALHLRRLAHALPPAALLPHSLASRRAVEAAAAVARLETHVATLAFSCYNKYRLGQHARALRGHAVGE